MFDFFKVETWTTLVILALVFIFFWGYTLFGCVPYLLNARDDFTNILGVLVFLFLWWLFFKATSFFLILAKGLCEKTSKEEESHEKE